MRIKDSEREVNPRGVPSKQLELRPMRDHMRRNLRYLLSNRFVFNGVPVRVIFAVGSLDQRGREVELLGARTCRRRIC